MAVLQRLIPKRIEIKPMVRRKPGVMLETIAIQDYFLGESLKKNFVAVASMIEAEEQDDGTMHHGGDENGADRKGCRCAEELTLRGLAVARRPVTQRSNEKAGVQALLYF